MIKRYRLAMVIMFLAITVPVDGAVAAILAVCKSGCDYSKIQDAIDGAVDNDTVLVDDGSYTENINFKGKAITVKSKNGAGKTVIDGSQPIDPNYGSVVIFASDEGNSSVLDGFNLSGGTGSKPTGSLSYGGGIYCRYASPSVTNCIIEKNEASSFGGGIYCYDSSLFIANSKIISNVADDGGGISFLLSNAVIIDSIISKNHSNFDGGGISCPHASASPQIINCVISSNTADGSGGGLYCGYTYSPSPRLANCIIKGNQSNGDGGGISCNSSYTKPTISNCTIVFNSTDSRGGGISYSDFSSSFIINTIIWSNHASDINEAIYLYPGSSTDILYSDIQDGWGGEGNIDADPNFIDPEKGNYRLKPGSPCIDAASSGYPALPTDKDGNPRYDDPDTINTGAGDINYYDMGAYEYRGIPCPIYVPDDYPTIQGAINAVSDGCTIIVREGTYAENINFLGKAITVRTTEGATIDGSNNGSVVTFVSGEGSGSVLDGFTITKGSGTVGSASHTYGGGIYCDSSSPSINNCKIVKNSASNYGGGIYCRPSSSPTITNCSISSNSGAEGGGIFCYLSSSPTISNCIIKANEASGKGGGIHCGYSSSPFISSCKIFSNSASIDGGGVFLYSSSPTIQNSIIKDNTVNFSGGGFYILQSSPTIKDSTISNNIGAGITCATGSHSYVANCLIKNNTYSPNTDSGGGLGCGGGNPLVVNSTITSNLAITYGGGIYLQDSCFATVINSIVWGNKNESGGAYSTEIFIRDGNGSIDITYSDIQGGYTGEGNIDSNPLFIGDGNYHLQSASPCIDAANSNPPAPPTDMDGNSRHDDPYTDDTGAGANGTYYDMGVYEYGIKSLNFNAGWNLISLNLQPDNTAVNEVFGTVSNSCNSVWRYTNGWTAYYPAYPGYSDLNTMETGWGYWLKMNASTTLSVSGTTPSKTISLIEGWNLVGFNSSTTLPITEAIQTVDGDCESVWQFKDGVWKAYYPAYPQYSDLETMEPNYGYWIKTNKACIWTLP